MPTSGPASANMHEVPAGVAQLAEQPSCKRQVSGSIPLTGSTFPDPRKPSHLRFSQEESERHGRIRAPGLQDPHKEPTTAPRRQACSGFGSGPARGVRHRDAGGRPRGNAGEGRVVVEVEGGITVYPARGAGDRWRAVWYENGQRRQCQAASEERLAARLAKVAERLAADAPNMERTGADLVAFFLSPDRLPPARRWSRKHAHTQARLCQRFVSPVIGPARWRARTSGSPTCRRS
jgi:hypothetical protein